MKFEQLLQIYWAKGLFFNGNLRPFDFNVNTVSRELTGVGFKNKKNLIKRFELTHHKFNINLSINDLSRNIKKTLNMFWSQTFNVLYPNISLIKYNLIRF